MSTPFTADHLARRCRIAAVVIRSDALVCTFQASSWLDFCRQVVETADGLWAAGKGVARVFGCEDIGVLEEHNVEDCRRVVAADAVNRP